MTVEELEKALRNLPPAHPTGAMPAPYRVRVRVDGMLYDVEAVHPNSLGVVLELRRDVTVTTP